MSEELILENKPSNATLAASHASYEVEKIIIDNLNATVEQLDLKIDKYFKDLVENKDLKFDEYIEYLGSYYDEKQSICGVTFKDKKTNEIIIAYAGTNIGETGIKSSIKDIYTDIVAIGLNENNTHANKASEYYLKIKNEYPNDYITLTGHSLGGNVAMNVALVNNHHTTITYNSAPLRVLAVNPFINPFNGLKSIEKRYKNILNEINYNELNKKFTGKIIDFVSEEDELRFTSKLLGAKFVGKEYIILNGGHHGIEDFKNIRTVNFMNGIIEANKLNYEVKTIKIDINKDGISDIIKTKEINKESLTANVKKNKNGVNIKIDVESLTTISTNIKSMAIDIEWIENSLKLIEEKNNSILIKKENRENVMITKINENLNEFGYLNLIRNLDDSFGKIENYKTVIEELGNINITTVKRKFDNLGDSAHRKWFDINDKKWNYKNITKKLSKIKEASEQFGDELYQTIQKIQQNHATSYRPTGIPRIAYSKIAISFEEITNQIYIKTSEIFKGTGKREVLNDAMAEAIKQIISAQLENILEIKKSIKALAEAFLSVAQNIETMDEYVGNALKNKTSIFIPDVNINKTYEAYLKDCTIFDDVHDIGQAYDKQVEAKSTKLAEEIINILSIPLDQFLTARNFIMTPLAEMQTNIDYIFTQIYRNIYYQKKEYNGIIDKNKYIWGQLKNAFENKDLNNLEIFYYEVKKYIVNFEETFVVAQEFRLNIEEVKVKLKNIVENAVYDGLDFFEIRQVQNLCMEQVNALISQLNTLQTPLLEYNESLSISTLSQKTFECAKSLNYFGQVIKDVFGNQDQFSEVLPAIYQN